MDIVVKVGGRLMSDRGLLRAVFGRIRAVASKCSLVVVPGGGVYADAVREMDRRIGLSDDDAHWRAVAAMDESAAVVEAQLREFVVVSSPDAITEALEAGRIPILAPSVWLRDADPLPHSWDVTSDSIAAWVAGQLGASRLILIKPPGTGLHRSGDAPATGLELVDPWFVRALPAGLTWTLVSGDCAISEFDELAGHRSR